MFPFSARPVESIGYDQQKIVRLLNYGGETINVMHEGPYRITLAPFGKNKWGRGDVWVGGPFKAAAPGTASFEMKKVRCEAAVKVGDTQVVFDNVKLPAGRNGFRITFEVAGKKVYGIKDADGDNLGPVHITFERE